MKQKNKYYNKFNKIIRCADNFASIIVGFSMILVWTELVIPSIDEPLMINIILNSVFVVALLNIVWRLGFSEVLK